MNPELLETLARWSDNLIYSATAVMALAFFAHAAEWAYARERRVANKFSANASGTVGSDAVGAAGPNEAGGGVAVLERTASAISAGSADGDGGTEDPDEVRRERSFTFGRIGMSLTVLATVLLGLGATARGFAAERVPWSNLWEFSTTGTFVVGVVYLLASRKFRLGWLGMPVTGFLLVVLGIAIALLYTPVSELIPSLQSAWLVIHVSAAVLSVGVFSVGFLATVLQLVRARAERRAAASSAGGEGQVTGALGRLPAARSIDRIVYRLHAFAFPLWTFALISGAIWAERAWGRYWGWDPKEVWMFITWVLYAAFLHAYATAGWRNKASWIAIAGYAALLFNLIGVNFVVTGLHSYAGV